MGQWYTLVYDEARFAHSAAIFAPIYTMNPGTEVVHTGGVGTQVFFWIVLFGLLALYFFTRKRTRNISGRTKTMRLERSARNPILSPRGEHGWENEAVFNPAAVLDGDRVHLFYRALGSDGVSRVGYAWSDDGFHFERAKEPVYVPSVAPKNPVYQNPFAKRYDRDRYASGGGWAGAEDPRAVRIENHTYLSFTLFEGWGSIRMAITSIPHENVKRRLWNWRPHILMSPPNQTHKNWVLFPEKINGKFAILHALTPTVSIEYIDSLETLERAHIKSNNQRGGLSGRWDSFVRGAAAPPVRTPRGWLLLYHGMDVRDPGVGYRVGAMLLDLEHPEKVLYRSAYPILSPEMPYENDWKPGVVYASAAVVKDGTLFVYYGGGDKTVNVATAPLERFLSQLTGAEHIELARSSHAVS